ncbi:DNA repair protein RAD50 [Nematocida major]|uniref:DNA repair protein RAD50 n=1 Tax=Nematocida major TaxID=1912982 RepID=UPI002008D5D3|nr:DNA repair protein RAD50 [Nematocida major]KAH9387034.1 DNA repair protein RAD50 [Nematocida major]
MSGIGKLKIKGIRAFTEEHAATIEMQNPLTLIVGHNGTGKTTIVEALKYATTGSLPPNSRNGAFVHDPRVSQEVETKAQIMMKFTSCEGKQYVVVRGMSQTVGKVKRETKTVESVLWEVDSGEKRMICNKLSEVDSEVPFLLGTTPAVLESVIFVHQEESAWPFGDATVLKKKMDAIFSSSKFVKAIESLTVLKKEKAGEVKLLACKYEALQLKTQNKHVIEQRIARSVGRLETVRDISEKAKERMDRAQIDLREAQKRYEHSLCRLREKEKAQSELHGLSTKKLIPGTVEELEALLPGACLEEAEELKQEGSILEVEHQDVLEKIRRLEDLRCAFEQSKTEAHALRLEKERKTSELKGALSQSRQAMDRMCVSMQEIMHSMKSELQSEPEEELRPEQRGELDSEINSLAERVDLFAETNRRLTMEDGPVESALEVEAIVDDEVHVSDGMKSLAEDVDRMLDQKMHRKETSVRRKTEQVGALKEKRRGIAKRLEELQCILDDSRNEQESSFIAEIQENENIIGRPYVKKPLGKERLFQEIEEAQKELEHALKEAEKRKEKEFLLEEIERRQREIEYAPCPVDIKGEMSYESVVEAEEAVEKKMLALDARIQEMQRRQKTAIDSRLKADSQRLVGALMAQQKTKKIEEILKGVTGEIKSGGSAITKSEILEKVKEGVKLDLACNEEQDVLYELGEEWGGISASERIYEEFLSRAQEGCPFCKSFISTGVSKGQVQKIQGILECIRRKKEEIQREIQSEQEKAKTKRHQAILRALMNELSAMLCDEHVGARTEEADGSQVLEEWAILLERLGKQLQSIRDIKSKYVEIEALRAREEKIRIVHEDYSTASARYKKKLEELQDVEREEQRELENHNAWELRKEQSRERIQEIERQLQQRNKHRKEAALLEKECACLEGEKKATDALLQKRVEEIEKSMWQKSMCYKAKEAIKAFKSTNAQIVDITTAKGKIVEIFARLEALSRHVYTEAHRKTEVQLKNQLIEIEEKKSIIFRKISAVTEAHNHRQLVKDSIRASVLERHIAECHVTQDTLACLQKDTEKIEAALMKDQKTISECAGERHNLQKQKEEDEADVKIHASAEADELSAFITMKVLQDSILDLEKYIKGVQAAIVRYHSEKLAEVNAIIKEIWSIAYKGSDIDEMKIVSYLDKTYSLVMVKNGVEIDMKGRVSAGQKVLASIVIRLALAEAFSLNCGFLSLDEPTTNLDKANIAGLARALSSIIRARKAEGNFQLLVITHDEEFVRELLSTECTEYFYRLERDVSGTPKIVQLSIYDI